MARFSIAILEQNSFIGFFLTLKKVNNLRVQYLFKNQEVEIRYTADSNPKIKRLFIRTLFTIEYYFESPVVFKESGEIKHTGRLSEKKGVHAFGELEGT